MEIEGMIIRDLGLFEGTSKAGNPWKKHEWVLETTGQYPRRVKFDVFGDRTNTVTFEVGKSYVIQVDVESREYNERWYTDLHAYAARPLEAAPQQMGQPGQPAGPVFTQPQQPVAAAPKDTVVNIDITQEESTDDLPF